ncbi:MAG: hypothetical protein ACTSQY_10610 [Candidatus Odinarchaeia archaeon]
MSPNLFIFLITNNNSNSTLTDGSPAGDGEPQHGEYGPVETFEIDRTMVALEYKETSELIILVYGWAESAEGWIDRFEAGDAERNIYCSFWLNENWNPSNYGEYADYYEVCLSDVNYNSAPTAEISFPSPSSTSTLSHISHSVNLIGGISGDTSTPGVLKWIKIDIQNTMNIPQTPAEGYGVTAYITLHHPYESNNYNHAFTLKIRFHYLVKIPILHGGYVMLPRATD